MIYCWIASSASISHSKNTHPFNGPFSGTTQVSRYQKGKTNLDFTEARDSEWQWHQLGHMQVCTSLHTENHASTPPLIFLQAGCPSCRPTNSVKALKALAILRSTGWIYTGWAKKNGLFFRLDNFVTVSPRKACSMSKFSQFYREKGTKLAFQWV